jgi:DNA-binding NarL/FixJ family response regulator
MRASTVLFVDPNLHFLRVATRLLCEHYSDELVIVGTSRGNGDALEQAQARKPQIVLLDLDGNFSGNIQLIPQLRAMLPDVGIIVLGSHDRQEYRQAALDAGAHAFVLKCDLNHALIPAIRTISKKVAASTRSVRSVGSVCNSCGNGENDGFSPDLMMR